MALSHPASLLTGTLGLQPVPTWAEVLAWVAYAVPMGLYVLWPPRTPVPKVPDAARPATVPQAG